MTRKQRRVEADYWLRQARRASRYGLRSYMDLTNRRPFLCRAKHLTRQRKKALGLFCPEGSLSSSPWWNAMLYGDRDHDDYGFGHPQGRVIAACLLAAMAEAGDLGWTQSAT